MAMGADVGAGLHGVEQALAGFLVIGVKIEVLPPPGVGGGLPAESGEQLVIDDFHRRVPICEKP